MRRELWVQFTAVYQRKNLYGDLKELDLATDFQTSIAKDIHRTKATPKVRQEAKNILEAFAKYNPYIGYCQGMNYIAAFLAS